MPVMKDGAEIGADRLLKLVKIYDRERMSGRVVDFDGTILSF